MYEESTESCLAMEICMTSFCHVAWVTYPIVVSGALSKVMRVGKQLLSIYLHMMEVYDLLYVSRSLILFVNLLLYCA